MRDLPIIAFLSSRRLLRGLCVSAVKRARHRKMRRFIQACSPNQRYNFLRRWLWLGSLCIRTAPHIHSGHASKLKPRPSLPASNTMAPKLKYRIMLVETQ
jgi:hypothetical protein